MLLLCITNLLSQSFDNLSCLNGLPKHPLQYNLFLLALTSTTGIFGYILFIILPGTVITPHDRAHCPSVQWLPPWERSCVRYRRLLIQTPSWWSPHPHYSPKDLWKCHWNTLAWLYTSNLRTQHRAAKRPRVRHCQMALLLIIWWQIYTAGARPLLMLFLDGAGLKTIQTITSILWSVKSSM